MTTLLGREHGCVRFALAFIMALAPLNVLGLRYQTGLPL